MAEISSNTAVARAVAARDTFAVVALRADDAPVALRTTFDDAARPAVVCVAVVADTAVRGVAVALRAETFDAALEVLPVAVRTTVVAGRRVALRDTVADGAC